jgi:lipopolysaccharide export system permease protein
MNTLQRYILKEFFKPFIFIMISFVGLYIIAQLVDEMRAFVEHRPVLSVILLYYLYRIPFFAVQVMPLAVLLTALLSLGQLSRQNELIALRASGVSFFQVVSPIGVAALGLVGVMFIFNEIVLPTTNPKADYIKRVRIEKKADDGYSLRRDRIARRLPGNYIIYIKQLDAQAGQGSDVILTVWDEKLHGIKERFDAPFAQWQNGLWTLTNPRIRLFDNMGNVIRYQEKPIIQIPIASPPKAFIREPKNDTELLSTPTSELLQRIRSYKELGTNPLREEVQLYLKFAFPFANFILALLGVSLPFLFPSGQRALIGAAIGFVVTLITGFFYIGFIAIGSSLGNSGALPPWLAVWMGNIIFSVIGVLALRQART